MLRRVMVLMLLVFLVGCGLPVETSQTSPTVCEELKENFDNQYNSIDLKWCLESPEDIWVGGTLINISKTAAPWYNRDEYRLTFFGKEKTNSLSISIFYHIPKEMPYQTGEFYKFNLRGFCPLWQSMASSGMFSDPDLNALERLEECE